MENTQRIEKELKKEIEKLNFSIINGKDKENNQESKRKVGRPKSDKKKVFDFCITKTY